MAMVDESGPPHHVLIDAGGKSSIVSERSKGKSNSLYDSQRGSLFDEFVDETKTNFARSEFDKSISLIEFRIQSQIFTRKHVPEKRKKKRFGSSKSKKTEETLPDPQTEFSLSIGDVLMCKWSGDEDNWDTKLNDPNQFPYLPHPEPDKVDPPTDKKSKKKSKEEENKEP